MRFANGPGSIAWRLFLTAAALSFPLLLVASILLTQYYRRGEEESFNSRLDAYVESIATEISDAAREGRDIRDMDVHFHAPVQGFETLLSGWYWQVTRMDAKGSRGPADVVAASRSLFAAELPRLPTPRDAGNSPDLRRGLAVGPDGSVLALVERHVTVDASRVFLVQVGVTTNFIEPRIERFRWILLSAFALLGLALAVAATVQVRFGLRPLRLLREELGDVRRGRRERIEGAYPQEVAPLVDEVNLLIGTNREIVERARTQVGNLAHALKTPLSVIVNEAEADPTPLAAKVGEQAKVMRDQVAYYLDRARAAARAGAIGASTQVSPAVAALLRTFGKIYDGRGVEFSGKASETLWFSGERQDFDEMVGNLLDNAGKWAKSAVSLEVTLEPDAAGPCRSLLLFAIEDDGPGLAAELREAATKRGQRLDETKPGSGLGLSIVTDLASAYGGSLKLSDGAEGGLRAELRLPGF